MNNLHDKIIVVIGGSGFVGLSLARAIEKSGGLAVIADKNITAYHSGGGENCEKFPDRLLRIHLDITDTVSVANLISQLNNKYKRIDAVVNCAYPRNSNYGRKIEDVTYEDFCENTNLHLGGYFLVAKHFAMYFQQQGWGNIINLGSVYGTMTPRFNVYFGTSMTMPIEYAAVKAGLIHMTRYFAQYFKGQHIRVNSLSPGGLVNNQPETFLKEYNSFCNEKGMLDPVDVMGALLFLLSDESKYITGQNIIIDDGFSL